jgi:hypothetical protein
MDSSFQIANIKVKPENKYCPLIFKRGEYSLSIKSEEYDLPKNSDNTIFIFPIREFLACGSIWQAINLCTIFWEKPAYNMERSYNETQHLKISYLMAFASDLAPICKHWAAQCLEKTIKYIELEDKVYIHLELFNNPIKEKIIKALDAYNYKFLLENNIYTVS